MIRGRRRTALLLAAALGIAALGVARCGPDRLRILTPPQGSFHPDSSVELSGVAPGGAAGVTVNGAPAHAESADDWTFLATLPTGPVFHPFVARRASGETLLRTLVAGPALEEGAASPRALALRIGEDGLRALALALEQSSLLAFDNLVAPGDELGSLDVDRARAGHASVKIKVVDGRVKLRISVFDLEIDGEAKNQGPFDEDCDVDIDADRLTMAVHMELRPVSENGTSVLGGKVKKIALDFEKFDGDVSGCDVSEFLADLAGDVEADIKDRFEDGVRDFLGQQAFAEELRSLTRVLSDVDVDIDAPLAVARESADGVTLVHDLVVHSPARAPGAPRLTASLDALVSDPRFDEVTPGTAAPYGFALGLSASALNQLLRAETVGGFLRDQVLLWDPDAPSSLLSLLLADLGHGDPSQPLYLKVDPRLAPVVEEDAPESGGLLAARVGQLELTIWNGATGATRARVATTFPVGLDLAFDQGEGRPLLAAPAPDEVGTVVLVNRTARDDAFVALLFEQLLAQMLPELGGELGTLPALSVPLLREGAVFARLAFEPVEASRQEGVPALFADATTQVCLEADGAAAADTLALLCGHDEDRDGVASGAGAVRTEVCAATPRCPTGWTEVDAASPVDCDDLDDRVFPGQDQRFGRERRDGSYDFDCDGEDERK